MATRAALITALILLNIWDAAAQPVSGRGSSVEWMAADACLIVRGVIEDISEHALKDGLHGNAGINRYQTLSLRVLETLKGEHLARLQFVQNGDFGRFRLTELKENEQELLLFLEPWSLSGQFRRAGGGYAYTAFPLVVMDVMILNPDRVEWAHRAVPVLTSNLTPLSNPEQTVAAITSYLKNRDDHAPVRSSTIELPEHLRGPYYRVEFSFPLDAVDADRSPDQTAKKTPLVDFETFKERFSRKPPPGLKPPYSRDRGGYIGVDALELMAADCDMIVRCVVEEAAFVSRPGDPTGDGCGIRVRVVETIKGRTQDELACFVSDARDLEELRGRKQELILFLRSNRDGSIASPEGSLEFRTRANLWDDSVIVLEEEAAEVLFADLTWSNDPEKIVNRLRVVAEKDGAGASTPGCSSAKTPVFNFHPPASLTVGASISGNPYSVVALPVNQDLEDNARSWATSENKDLRWLSARSMIYFKSDKNAAVLEELIEDDATWERREMLRMTGLAHPFRPEFLVRWEAWHVLNGWGYDAPPAPIFVSDQ